MGIAFDRLDQITDIGFCLSFLALAKGFSTTVLASATASAFP